MRTICPTCLQHVKVKKDKNMRVNFLVERELIKKAREYAKENGIDLSKLLRDLLSSHVY